MLILHEIRAECFSGLKSPSLTASLPVYCTSTDLQRNTTQHSRAPWRSPALATAPRRRRRSLRARGPRSVRPGPAAAAGRALPPRPLAAAAGTAAQPASSPLQPALPNPQATGRSSPPSLLLRLFSLFIKQHVHKRLRTAIRLFSRPCCPCGAAAAATPAPASNSPDASQPLWTLQTCNKTPSPAEPRAPCTWGSNWGLTQPPQAHSSSSLHN